MSSNVSLYIPVVLVSLSILKLSELVIVEKEPSNRVKRQLLFPNSTLLQFNAGIGTPSPAKMINVNWAFQANFQLPWNRSQIPVDILEANSGYVGMSRKKRDADRNKEETKKKGDYENNFRLIHFYTYIEDILNVFGYNGSSCILQTLCKLGAEPLHYDDEDLLHEIASYVLNPHNDLEQSQKDNTAYIDAYSHGQSGKSCVEIYKECPISLVDMFTKLHDEYLNVNND